MLSREAFLAARREAIPYVVGWALAAAGLALLGWLMMGWPS